VGRRGTAGARASPTAASPTYSPVTAPAILMACLIRWCRWPVTPNTPQVRYSRDSRCHRQPTVDPCRRLRVWPSRQGVVTLRRPSSVQVSVSVSSRLLSALCETIVAWWMRRLIANRVDGAATDVQIRAMCAGTDFQGHCIVDVLWDEGMSGRSTQPTALPLTVALEAV
jgi:hypothetical protein